MAENDIKPLGGIWPIRRLNEKPPKNRDSHDNNDNDSRPEDKNKNDDNDKQGIDEYA